MFVPLGFFSDLLPHLQLVSLTFSSQASANLVLGRRFFEVKSIHEIGLRRRRIVLCMVTQHRS